MFYKCGEGLRCFRISARTFSAERIDIIDLNITTFNGDASAKVDAILLCRELASFFPNAANVRCCRLESA